MALPRVPMANFLIQKGYLKPEQLEQAKQVQVQSKKPLDRVLIELNFVGEREVLQAKAQEMGFGFADLDRVTIDSKTLEIIPERIVKSHSVLPVKKQDNQLWVAMKNPQDIQAIDDIVVATGCRVVPVIAVPDAIDDSIAKYYSGDKSNGGATVDAPGSVGKAGSNPAMAPLAAGNYTNLAREAMAQAAVQRGGVVMTDDDAGGAADEETANQAPIIKLANALIQQAISDRASDIHVEPQPKSVRVRYRVDGVLTEAMTIPRNLMAPLISRLKIMSDMNIAERRVPQDGRIEIRHQGKELDLRVSTVPTPYGEKVVMRILDKSGTQIGLGKLGFLEENQLKIEELVSQPNGMFLCTGPTGSGKTTTLYSVLYMLNTVGVNILTAEDPVEYQLSGITQVGMNRKAGLTFATALRAFLRQDPDIIMVGEIRDLETAEISIEASLTGHLVLSTLHTNDAPSATLRMIDMGVEPYLIAATLMGVLAQRLGRKVDPDHREAYQIPASDLRRFGFQHENPEELITLYRGVPHEDNRMTGYRGRTGFHELMVMNNEIAELVVRRAPLSDIKAAAKANGMHELREDGLVKVLAGQTDPGEVMRVVFTAGY